MRAPPGLASLLEDGLIEAVLRPLQSGKEAEVYLVRWGGEVRIAKVYKAAERRNFKNRSAYQEGRGTRNTRDQRAMRRRSGYGRSRDEEAWQSTEVEMIHRLREAGVRVPKPFVFADGVLIMELVQGADGSPAPRLGDLRVSAEDAVAIHDALLRDVVRMLCAGVVHGDLSEFNVLVDDEGPVIIDLPQAVDASSNQNARTLLLRDVENLQRFVTRWVPGRKRASYAAEMWALYEVNELRPDTELTGVHEGSKNHADTEALLGLIADAEEDETMRRLQRGLAPLATESGGRRVYINREKVPARGRKPSRSDAAKGQAAATAPPSPEPDGPPCGAEPMGPRRRPPGADSEPSRGRRRRRGGRGPSGSGTTTVERRTDSAPADRARPRGDSGANESRRRRRRRRKPDSPGDRPAAAERREEESAPRSGKPAKQQRSSERSGRPPRKKRVDDRRRRSSADGQPEPRRDRDDAVAASHDRPPKRRRRRRRRTGGGSGSSPGKTDN